MSPAIANVHSRTKVTFWGSFNLETMEKKGKVPCSVPCLWWHMVTVHKLFWINITQQIPPHKQLCAVVVLHWSFRNRVKQTPCCTDEPLVILQGKLVPITVSSWVWLNGSSGCFFSMTSSQSKGCHGGYKEHRVVNQDPPIHSQFNIIPWYPNTPAFNYSWPERKGNRVRYIHKRKLN